MSVFGGYSWPSNLPFDDSAFTFLGAGLSVLTFMPGVMIAVAFFSWVEFSTHNPRLCKCSLTVVIAPLLAFMLLQARA